MASLSAVISAMSKEVNDSTLGWDAVVNYSAKDINAVLKSAYDKGQEGQLKELTVSLDMEDFISGAQYVAVFKFQLGPPLIQFEASASMTSSCRLDIAVTGGSVVIEQYNMEYTIPADRYRLALTGIALASVNGTKGADRNPQPSDRPFVFNSPNTTGAVTIDIETSAKENRLQVALSVHGSGEGVSIIDKQTAELGKKILTHFQQAKSIHWDIAQVNNARPSSGTSQLVPKVFRFACYAPDNTSGAYTVLSLFIHLDGGFDSGTQAQLQEKWSILWGKPDSSFPNSYGVPPIPESYTASVILNHRWIQNAVAQSVKDKGMKIEEIPKTSNDTFSLKSKILTGQRYKVDRIRHTGTDWPYSVYSVEAVDIDLDSLPAPLYISIGQNNEPHGNALLQWQFEYTTGWMWVNGGNGDTITGKVTATNKLDKKVSFDNNVLPDYRIHLNLNVDKKSWEQKLVPSDSNWSKVISVTNYGNVSLNALPDPPPLDLKLFDIDFFMTTNLLLPNQDVIDFRADPGVLFPRDLYLVGHVIDQVKLSAKRSVRAQRSA